MYIRLCVYMYGDVESIAFCLFVCVCVDIVPWIAAKVVESCECESEQ